MKFASPTVKSLADEWRLGPVFESCDACVQGALVKKRIVPVPGIVYWGWPWEDIPLREEFDITADQTIHLGFATEEDKNKTEGRFWFQIMVNDPIVPVVRPVARLVRIGHLLGP